MSRPGRSLFGPLALIGLGVILLVHNLTLGYSLWTLLVDHWPWFLVAWGGAHVVQQLIARAQDAPGPRRLGAGAVLLAILICLAGETARAVRDNDGLLFRGFGVRVQVRDPAFQRDPPAEDPMQSPSHNTP